MTQQEDMVVQFERILATAEENPEPGQKPYNALIDALLRIRTRELKLPSGSGERVLRILTDAEDYVSAYLMELVLSETSGVEFANSLIESEEWRPVRCYCGAQHMALLAADAEVVIFLGIKEETMRNVSIDATSCRGGRVIN